MKVNFSPDWHAPACQHQALTAVQLAAELEYQIEEDVPFEGQAYGKWDVLKDLTGDL